MHVNTYMWLLIILFLDIGEPGLDAVEAVNFHEECRNKGTITWQDHSDLIEVREVFLVEVFNEHNHDLEQSRIKNGERTLPKDPHSPQFLLWYLQREDAAVPQTFRSRESIISALKMKHNSKYLFKFIYLWICTSSSEPFICICV